MKRFVPLGIVLALLAAGVLVACGSDSGSTSGREELLVIDQNILHGLIDEDPAAANNDRFPERIQLFAAAVGKEKPDILFMQEVVGTPDDPNYPDPRAKVLDALGSGYQAVFGNFLAGPVDDPGLGQMTFTKLPITAKENHKVSAIRSVQHIALQTQNGTVDVYNAHLEGTGAVLETGEDAAVAEMDAVIAFIEETRDGSGPVILAGDLNAEPDDPSIQRLIAAGFIDALAEAGDATCDKAGDPGCTNSEIPLGDNPEHLSDHRIDYVFVKSGGRVIDVKEAKLFLREPIDIGDGHTLHVSDHIGLIVRLEMRSVEG
jgi:endonuclease/exonuclease/phosphatase family metal-dependent hydrolase